MQNSNLKTKSQNSKRAVFTFCIVILISAFLFLIWRLLDKNSVQGAPLDAFAQCLAENGMVMYGAYWCPHCQNEKKAFGDSFRLVNYVECTKETQKCLRDKIEGYPVWIFADGRRLEGEQGVEKLAEESGCSLP